jgi:hypothetical protein
MNLKKNAGLPCLILNGVIVARLNLWLPKPLKVTPILGIFMSFMNNNNEPLLADSGGT